MREVVEARERGWAPLLPFPPFWLLCIGISLGRSTRFVGCSSSWRCALIPLLFHSAPLHLGSPRSLSLSQTINVRAGFLCNHEVLSILRQQRDARSKEIKALGEVKAKRVAKLGRKPFNKEQEDDEIERIQPQDLHTVTFEVRW